MEQGVELVGNEKIGRGACARFVRPEDRVFYLFSVSSRFSNWLDTSVHAASSETSSAALVSNGESKADAALDVSELAAWTLVSSQLLNLDETLNK